MNILDSSVATWISELQSGDLMCPNPGNRDMKGLCPRFSQGFVFKVTKPLAYVWNTEWTFIRNSLEKLKQIRKFLHISTVSNSAGKHLGSCFKDYISCHVKQLAIQHKYSRTNAHSFFVLNLQQYWKAKVCYCVNHLKTIFAGFGNHLFFYQNTTCLNVSFKFKSNKTKKARKQTIEKNARVWLFSHSDLIAWRCNKESLISG